MITAAKMKKRQNNLIVKVLFLALPVCSLPEIAVSQAACSKNYSDSTATYRIETILFESKGSIISGELYLPAEKGRYPAAILIPGGGSDVEILRNTPVFMAKRMSNCGLAAFVYDKRGTGKSGGDYSTSDFDDFIEDAGNAVKYLANHEEIDSDHIGAVGFSQGGRLVANVSPSFIHFQRIRSHLLGGIDPELCI